MPGVVTVLEMMQKEEKNTPFCGVGVVKAVLLYYDENGGSLEKIKSCQSSQH